MRLESGPSAARCSNKRASNGWTCKTEGGTWAREIAGPASVRLAAVPHQAVRRKPPLQINFETRRALRSCPKKTAELIARQGVQPTNNYLGVDLEGAGRIRLAVGSRLGLAAPALRPHQQGEGGDGTGQRRDKDS